MYFYYCIINVKLPVRRRMMQSNQDFQDLKKSLEIVSLAFPTISIKCNDGMKNVILINTKDCQSSMETFLQLFDINSVLNSIRLIQDNMCIHGFYSQDTHSSKHHQYIYVNQHYIESSDLYLQFNSYFLSKLGQIRSNVNAIFVVFVECPLENVHLVKTGVYHYSAEFLVLFIFVD